MKLLKTGKKLNVVVVLMLFLWSGCASLSLKTFRGIDLGMTKSDVLEQVGSPFKTDHRDGIDYWMYRFYEKETRILQEIQFQDGQVIYVGDVMNELERERLQNKSPLEKQQKLQEEFKKYPSPQTTEDSFQEISI